MTNAAPSLSRSSKSGLETASMEAVCLPVCYAAARCAKDLLPVLKPLQFARGATLREESTKAVESIEAAIKKK